MIVEKNLSPLPKTTLKGTFLNRSRPVQSSNFIPIFAGKYLTHTNYVKNKTYH